MKLFLGITIAAVALASAGWAQTPPDRPGRGDGQPRRVRPAQDQDAPRRGEARQDGARRQDPLAMLERAARQLDLDESQQAKFDEIIARHREEFEKNAETMRDLMRQMREAREAGDDAKAADIRRQIGELRGPGQMEKVLDEVEAILTDAQKEKLGQLRERMERGGQQRPGGPGGPGDPIARMEQLRERLRLDETQTAKFDELFTAFREAVKPAEGQPDPMQLQREMRQAVASGDRERAAEIRKLLDEHRKVVQAAADEFFQQLEPVLNADQKKMIENAREMLARGPAGPGGPDGARGARQNDARMLIRAAKRLDLTQEQKTQIDAIEKDATGKIREAGRDAEPETLAQIKTDVEKQIREILTSEQTKQFDQIVERLSNAGRGGPARDGEGDQPRRRRQAPPPDDKP